MSSAEETPIKQDAAAGETQVAEPQDSLEKSQVDGSGPEGNGSELADTKFNVEVKLADLQADPNNPLFSVKSFEDLQL
jgi:ATP-dependent RNA helicase DDX19/DBP5